MFVCIPINVPYEPWSTRGLHITGWMILLLSCLVSTQSKFRHRFLRNAIWDLYPHPRLGAPLVLLPEQFTHCIIEL